MSLDKLIAAATDYFTTGADVHRRALAGGGGKITDLSEKPVKKPAVTDVVANPVVAQPVNAAEAAVAEAHIAKVAEAKVVEAAAQVPAPEDDLEGGAPELDYETDIRPLLRAKTLTNRDQLIILLGTFGAKSGAELTKAQHPDFFAALKAL
jgi:hypothetical protein